MYVCVCGGGGGLDIGKENPMSLTNYVNVACSRIAYLSQLSCIKLVVMPYITIHLKALSHVEFKEWPLLFWRGEES